MAGILYFSAATGSTHGSRAAGLLARLALLGSLFAIAALPSSPALAASATRSTAYEYDAASGLLTKEIIEPGNPQLRVDTAYAYDAFGNRLTATVSSPATGDAAIAPRASASGYDAQGRFAVSASNALGHAETRVFDGRFGAVTSQTGPNGLTTGWTHDAFGRKILEVRPDGTRTKWEYLWCSGYNGGSLACPTVGGIGARHAVVMTPLAADGTTIAGAVETQYFDQLERELRRSSEGYASGTVEARAIHQDTEYDPFGRVKRRSRPYFPGEAPVWTGFAYDSLGRPVTETRPDGVVTIAYDALVTTVTNEWNEQRITTKNSQGQTLLVKNGRDDATTHVFSVNAYAYDPFGNLAQVTDPDGNVTGFTYDLRGRKTAMSDPDQGSWTYGYDVLGHLVRQTDALGQVTTLEYDLLGRMTRRVSRQPNGSADQIDEWTFDQYAKAIGKLSEAVSKDGDYDYVSRRQQAYDSLGRPSTTTISLLGGGFQTFTTQYDSLGRVGSVTYPSGLQLGYSYTGRSELKEIRDVAANAALWTLAGKNASRQVTAETFGNGVGIARSYDAGRGLVTGIQTVKAGAILQNWTIGYDSVGNVTGRSESVTAVTDSLVYDPLNRLLQAGTTAAGVSLSVSMTYSPGGNLLSKGDVGSYSYPAPGAGAVRPHAVTATGNGPLAPKSFSYDANGAMTAGDGRVIHYFGFGQPSQITRGDAFISFVHDAEHQRIQQALGNGSRKHYYTDPTSGARSERQLSSAGAHQRWTDFITSPGGVMLTISTTEVSYSHASVAVTRQYLHRDHLGSVTLVTDAAGAVLQRMSYDAWGRRRNTNGTADSAGLLEDGSLPDRGYTDHEHLEELLLIHMNGRLYDPVIARFVSADPIVQDPFSGQAFNRYSYVDNNPLTYTDPTGYLKLGRIFSAVLSPITIIPGVRQLIRSNEIVAGLFQAAGAFVGGPIGAAASAAVVTEIRGGSLGDMFRSAVIAYATAEAFSAVGDATGGHLNPETGMFGGGGLPGLTPAEYLGSGRHIANILGHAAVGCGSALASGGNCAAQAFAAGVGSLAGPKLIDAGAIGGLIASSVIGGTASVIGGGNFANGAKTSTFGYLFNQMGRNALLGAAVGAGAGLAAAAACDMATMGVCAAVNPAMVAVISATGAAVGAMADTASDGVHGNSANSMRGTEVYYLINRGTGAIDKIGITSNPGSRYTNAWLDAQNVTYVPQAQYTWRYAALLDENIRLVNYQFQHGKLPRLNNVTR